MQSALLVAALTLSSIGCHHGSKCVSGVRHGCYGGGYRQACYSASYGGCYGGGWVQHASYAPPVYRGGGAAVAPSGQVMSAVPAPQYGTAGSVAYSPVNYGVPSANTYPPNYGANTYPPNYGYVPAGSVASYGTPSPTGYTTGFRGQGWSPYSPGFGNYPGQPIPNRGMNTPYTYSSSYGTVPWTGQPAGSFGPGMGSGFPRLPGLRRVR